jgi:hypothetical protein
MAFKSDGASPNLLVSEHLRKNAAELEKEMDAHVLTWFGPIQPPVDNLIRQAVESRVAQSKKRQKRVAVVLQTPGGYIETAERIANTLRKHYRWVAFIVPDMAMSAGTVLVMSGDEIWMDYYSTLGPIDPQVERIRQDGSRALVPALGYLAKYDELVEKSRKNELTSAEAAYFVQNFDAAELFSYEQSRNLSIKLLKEWLVKYKFKNWKKTKTRALPVTAKMRRQRAEEIGKRLSDTGRWSSHSRGICMAILEREMKLKIEDIEKRKPIQIALDNYHGLLQNYLITISARGVLHCGEMLIPFG